jgi:hypothetical protein
MTRRGERMRKLAVILLIAGIILGMITVAGELGEESSSKVDPLYDMVEGGGGNPTPCGGEGGGGGGGAPG